MVYFLLAAMALGFTFFQPLIMDVLAIDEPEVEHVVIDTHIEPSAEATPTDTPTDEPTATPTVAGTWQPYPTTTTTPTSTSTPTSTPEVVEDDPTPEPTADVHITGDCDSDDVNIDQKGSGSVHVDINCEEKVILENNQSLI